MRFCFTETQKDYIIGKWGNEYLAKMQNHIRIFTQKWRLTDFEFAEFSSHNVILYCNSELYGYCVLKLYGLNSEYNALREFSYSGKFCKVYCFDKETKVLLIERILPGIMLKDEPSLDKKLLVFAEMYRGLHIVPENLSIYPSYKKLLSSVVEAMKTSGNKELLAHAQKANDIFSIIASDYSEEVLLHWDLNNKNILLDKNGQYRIIDPMGVVGYPVLDVGRFIAKECYDVPENRMAIV